MTPSVLLHGLVPLHGAAGLVLDGLAYLALLLAALALVLLANREAPILPDKLLWGVTILLLPLVGPLAFLLYTRRDGFGLDGSG